MVDQLGRVPTVGAGAVVGVGQYPFLQGVVGFGHEQPAGLRDPQFLESDDAIDMENYYEGITDLYTQDGVHYAIPKDHDTIAVIYNKAMFDKYDIDYPTGDWTWQHFADIAQEITEKGQADGIYGTYCNVSGNQDFWYNLVYSYGGEIINEGKTASGLDEPETIEAMNFLADEILPAPGYHGVHRCGQHIPVGAYRHALRRFLDHSQLLRVE